MAIGLRVVVTLLLALTVSGAVMADTLAARNATPPASSGARVFKDNCAVCHGADGKGTNNAPSLETVNDTDFITRTVQSGKGKMPSFAGKLSDAQVNAVAGYVVGSIAAAPLAGGDISTGGRIYRMNCSGCHGTTGRGGALIGTGGNAPELAGLAPAAISTAVRSGPGPMPIFSQAVISQQNLASLVLYVQTLQHADHPGGNPLGYRGPVTEGLLAVAVLGALALVAVWIENRGRG